MYRNEPLFKKNRKKKKNIKSKSPPLPPASRTIPLPDGKGGHEIASKSASRWDWDPRTGSRRAELELPKGNADLSPTPTWTRIRGQTPRAFAPGRRAAKRRPGQPRERTAIGDARSPGEGGREHNREGGEAARGAPGSAKRVLALGYHLLVLSQSSTTTTTNSYSFRNADLPCIRWDYIYIFCLSGFLVFVFAKIAKF